MLKFAGLVFALMLTTLILSQPAAAATLSLNNWQASGSQIWRITFPGYGGLSTIDGKTASGTSELYYPQSGNYATINYEKPLSPTHKINLEVGILGTFTSGTGTDSDWDYSQSEKLWHYGVFETGGNSTIINLDFKHTIGNNTDFFYGYGYSNSHYVMTQGHYSILDYDDNANISLPNLNSTYSLVYHGPHMGLATTKQLAPKLTLVGSLSYSPLTLVQGRGWWNLRDLNFRHLGTGQMIDGKIGLRYNVTNHRDNSLTLGYRYQQYNLFTGSENTSEQITWAKATKVQQGWYMGGDFSF